MGLIQTVPMARWDAGKSEWTRAFCERLRRARIDAGYSTRGEFSAVINVPVETYAKYENRSPLPPWLLPRVCEALRIDCWFLLTGRQIQQHMVQAAVALPHRTREEAAPPDLRLRPGRRSSRSR